MFFYQQKCIGNDFIERMHCKCFFTNKNVLEMILLSECIVNDFITIKMYWKLFYYKNVLLMFLL